MQTKMTPKLQSAWNMAQMATDTMHGLQRIGEIVTQWRVGLITEPEAIAALRGV